jgi:hypothetical protein
MDTLVKRVLGANFDTGRMELNAEKHGTCGAFLENFEWLGPSEAFRGDFVGVNAQNEYLDGSDSIGVDTGIDRPAKKPTKDDGLS